MALAPFPSYFGNPGLPIPWMTLGASINNTLINGTGHSVAAVGQVFLTSGPGTSKTISAAGSGRILFRAGSNVDFDDVLTTMKVGIQDVTTGGLEDGVYDVNADLVAGTDTITASAINNFLMESGSKTIAHGDRIAVVVEMTNQAGANFVSVAGDSTGILSPYQTNDTGAGPAKTTGISPMVTIKFDDGTLGWLGSYSFAWTAASTADFNTASNPDEIALLVQYPWEFDAIAVQLVMNAIDTPDDFEIILYSDPTGTPVVVETITVDVSEHIATNSGRCLITLPFAGLRRITNDTLYAIALRPTTANSVSLWELSVGGAAYRGVLPLGANVSKGSRQNQAGAFSEDTSLIPMIGLIPAQHHAEGEAVQQGLSTSGFIYEQG